MKGGKGGRPRTNPGGVAGRQGAGHGPAKKGSARQRPAASSGGGGAPKKGSRKKPHYGGTSTSSPDE